MTRAANLSKIVTDANLEGTLDVTGVLTGTSLDISGDIDVDGTTNLDVVDIDGAVDMASTLGVAGVVTANAGVVVDNITIDGTEIDLSSGDFTLDVAGNIFLDADGSLVVLRDGGTEYVRFGNSSSDAVMQSLVQDKDIIFKGNDGGSIITALTLDMSDAGTAIFNHDILTGLNANIDIRDADGHISGRIRNVSGSSNSLTIESDPESGAGSSFMNFKIDGSEHMRIDTSGNVIIGETSQINGGNLNLATSASDSVLSFLCRSTTDSHQPEIIMQKSSAASGNFAATADGEALGSIAFRGVDTQPVSQIAGAIDIVQDGTASGSVPANMRFSTGGSERLRIDSDGYAQLGATLSTHIGTSQLFINRGVNSLPATSGTTQTGGALRLRGNDNAVLDFGMNSVNTWIQATDRANLANAYALLLNPNGGGNITFGCTQLPSDSIGGAGFEDASSSRMILKLASTTTSLTNLALFYNPNGNVGGIKTDGSSTSFATSSDYRLKENVSYDFDATSRLKQLKPCRFNFKTAADTTVDGFIAHEVSSIVPEAITGEKDAMTEELLYVDGDEIPDGKKVGDVKEASKIDPQGIDQSKLVPLLTKALQEQQATIEALTARIVTLESA